MSRGPVLLALLVTCAVAGCGGDDDTSVPLADVRVVSINVLHGIFCPAETGDCRVDDRMDLLFEWIEDAGCPDVVLLQEVLGGRVEDRIRELAATRCPFAYEVHEPPLRSQNFTLSRYPVLATTEERLLGGIRVLWHVRIDHPTSLLDVFNTHLAAGGDGGSAPCLEPCPQRCLEQGAVSNRDCQAVQIADLTDQLSEDSAVRVLGGDFNATPDSFLYGYLTGPRGWGDTYVLAGNPECDAPTGVGCTSGREDEALGDMESSANGVNRRIDYLFVAGHGGVGCDFAVDGRDDADGDGLATKIFADDANPFADSCGPVPLPMCWPSDHEGMQLDLNCTRSVPRSATR